jgi:hypothetical protein
MLFKPLKRLNFLRLAYPRLKPWAVKVFGISNIAHGFNRGETDAKGSNRFNGFNC